MADFRFFYQFDLMHAIYRHDLRYISKALSAMVKTNQTPSLKILQALAKAIDPDQRREDGRKKKHFYFCDSLETKTLENDIALDYIFLCDVQNRELARFIVSSEDPITPPYRSITGFDRNKFRRKNFPLGGDIKSKICKIYGISYRSFDTYLSEHRKAEARGIEENDRMMEEMLGKPYIEFLTQYVADYRKKHEDSIDWEVKMIDEFSENYESISKHFWPEDWPPDDS